MAYDEKIKKKVQVLYEKGSTFKAILEQYKIPAKTIRQWASKYKWERKKGSKKSTETKQFRINKVGAPEKNTNAVKHGLFSKYLPAETLELVSTIETMSPLDILWENICLKYAAIIRSQKIMYVKDADDVTKRITMDGAEATAYQYTEAYEKQASFLMAQSRAMGTLMSLIKQYDEMCNSGLATEEQKLRIEKLKTEITKATDEEPVKVEIIDNISNVEVNTNANKFE